MRRLDGIVHPETSLYGRCRSDCGIGARALGRGDRSAFDLSFERLSRAEGSRATGGKRVGVVDWNRVSGMNRKCWRKPIPLLVQEGWTRHQENAAKPPL